MILIMLGANILRKYNRNLCVMQSLGACAKDIATAGPTGFFKVNDFNILRAIFINYFV